MKLTSAQLRRIIREEIERAEELDEGLWDDIKSRFGGKKEKEPEAARKTSMSMKEKLDSCFDRMEAAHDAYQSKISNEIQNLQGNVPYYMKELNKPLPKKYTAAFTKMITDFKQYSSDFESFMNALKSFLETQVEEGRIRGRGKIISRSHQRSL